MKAFTILAMTLATLQTASVSSHLQFLMLAFFASRAVFSLAALQKSFVSLFDDPFKILWSKTHLDLFFLIFTRCFSQASHLL